MLRRYLPFFALVSFSLSLALVGCDSGEADPIDSADASDVSDAADTSDTSDTSDSGVSSEHFVLDFSLPDANPSSPSFGQPISPRDYLNQVSGWYFIKAT